MSRKNGITSKVVCCRYGSLIWRWNMPLREAVTTYGHKSFGKHGYLLAGPLIVEW